MLGTGNRIQALVGGLLLLTPIAAAAAQDGGLLRLSELMGQDVFGRHKAPIATFSDIVIGPGGRAHYGLVERETLEAGAPLTAVPWRAFTLTEQGLSLQLSGSEMAQVPGFSEGDLPDFTSPQWQAQSARYFGAADRQATLPPFSELDADGDGRLSPGEIADHPEVAQRFGSADADRDGALDANEFSAFEAGERLAPGLEAPKVRVDVQRRDADSP